MTLAKEWKDGVLSIIMRGMSKNFKELGYHLYQNIKWVVLDGDIDAVWIESMNTVMDGESCGRGSGGAPEPATPGCCLLCRQQDAHARV